MSKDKHADADVDLFRHLNHIRPPGLARLISWPTYPGIKGWPPSFSVQVRHALGRERSKRWKPVTASSQTQATRVLARGSRSSSDKHQTTQRLLLRKSRSQTTGRSLAIVSEPSFRMQPAGVSLVFVSCDWF